MTSWASAVLANFSLSLGLSTCRMEQWLERVIGLGNEFKTLQEHFFLPKFEMNVD